MPDPVQQTADGKWHFADETWSSLEGPFDTEVECRETLKEYGEYLNTGELGPLLQKYYDRKKIYCHACSEAEAADMPIYHMPPVC